MNDHLDSVGELSAAELAALETLLARPEIWDDPPKDLEHTIVAAISAEGGDASPLSWLDDRRALRAGRSVTFWLAAAAACVVVIGGAVVLSGSLGGDEVQSADAEIELTGTAAAPEATAQVGLSATPAGLKIVIDVENLPPAPDGHFYEAWVSNGPLRVSAGTFHLRGGDKPIELWAGVVDPSFTRMSITLEPLDSDTDSSGDAQLVGSYDLGSD